MKVVLAKPAPKATLLCAVKPEPVTWSVNPVGPPAFAWPGEMLVTSEADAATAVKSAATICAPSKCVVNNGWAITVPSRR